jgi:hypothetical protein
MHGGTSSRGVVHHRTTHGGTSTHLPTRMLADYEAAMADPDLLSCRKSIAVLVARQADLARRVDSGEAGELWTGLKKAWKAFNTAMTAGDAQATIVARSEVGDWLNRGNNDYAAWREYQTVTEQLRKLRETERKLIEAHQATVTSEQVILLIGQTLRIIQSHVTDRKTLTAIGRDIERLTTQ